MKGNKSIEKEQVSLSYTANKLIKRDNWMWVRECKLPTRHCKKCTYKKKCKVDRT